MPSIFDQLAALEHDDLSLHGAFVLRALENFITELLQAAGRAHLASRPVMEMQRLRQSGWLEIWPWTWSGQARTTSLMAA